MNIQIRLSVVLTGALLVVPLSGCLSAGSVHPRAGSTVFPAPLKIAGFTIESQPLEGCAVPTGRETFVRHLASAATDQAARSLVQKGVAVSTGQLTVMGSVRMVVSLPPSVHGLAAARRKGSLATASVQLVDESGDVVATREASIAWSDVRWLAGAPRSRHSRPIEEVLLDGVRLSVDRAVEDLRDLLATRAEG